MTAPSAFAFSLACGVGGTYVDVTSDVLFEEGIIPFTDGRTSEFDGFGPGVWSFTLANGGGKYTPDNPATTLATPLSEGMGAVMQLDALKVSGTIRSAVLIFPEGKADTARVRVTLDDMLGNAARHEIDDNLATSMVLAAYPYLYYPLVDASEWSGRGNLNPNYVYGGDATGVVYGADGPAGDTQVTFTIPASTAEQDLLATSSPPLTLTYPSGSLGALGVWVTPSPAASWAFDIYYGTATNTQGGLTVDGTANSTRAQLAAPALSVTATGPALRAGVPSYVAAVGSWTFAAGNYTHTVDLYINGTFAATASGAPIATLAGTLHRGTDLTLDPAAAGEYVRFSHASHTATLVHEERAATGVTEATRLSGIAAAVPEITLDSLPAGLSAAVLAAADDGGQSALDAFNDVIRAEQGYMWSETTGTLLAPVEKIKVAPRDRGRAIDYTFDVSEIVDPIPFVRSLANTVYQFTATGPDTAATYTDPTAIPLVGSASSSDSVPLRDFVDLYSYATDRVARGITHGYPIRSIQIDATSPYISRWAALSAIRQGFRLHITGLPTTQLGYSTWDGWVVGRQIDNTQDSDDVPKSLFTFHLAPWVRAPVYDTDVYGAGGVLTLSANINSAVTTMSIATSDTLTKLTTTALPRTAVMGTERMTITNVTAATPQVVTMTRGVGGTTAAAHTAGDSLEIYDPALYAY